MLSVSIQVLIVGASLSGVLMEGDCGNFPAKPLQAVARGIYRATAPSAVSIFKTTTDDSQILWGVLQQRQTAIN